MVLPPGWVRIPLRGGTWEALDEKVFRGIEEIPEGVPREKGMAFRLAVRRRIGRMVGEARKAGGLDLYVPARARPGVLMAASFLVSELARPEGEAASPEVVLGRLAGDRRGGEGGALRGVGGTVAVRWEYVEPPGGEDVDMYARHVDYVLPVPGDDGRWLAVNFSTGGDGAPGSEFTRALAELFDALMTTFRWHVAE
ncbi:hypothetical protein [Streptomyces sp.]|uniref:hypothetical protein n=1 Tax=Streptomyces sp. TaxID=1931 RepID=UPI002F3F579C